MKSTILYSKRILTDLDFPADYTTVPVAGGGEIYVRAESRDTNVDDALFDATPRTGEVVLNSVSLDAEAEAEASRLFERSVPAMDLGDLNEMDAKHPGWDVKFDPSNLPEGSSVKCNDQDHIYIVAGHPERGRVDLKDAATGAVVGVPVSYITSVVSSPSFAFAYHASRSSGVSESMTAAPCSVCGWAAHAAIHDVNNRHLKNIGHAYKSENSQ
jgi:hypothetical protein